MLHFEAVVRRVPTSAWGNATCCTEWNARELVGHTLKVMTFTEAACGIQGTVPDDSFEVIAGEDPVVATGLIVNRVLEALEEAAKAGKGAAQLDGKMIDIASERMARNVIAQADQIAAKSS